MTTISTPLEIEKNVDAICAEINWFKEVLEFQMSPYLQSPSTYNDLDSIPCPNLRAYNSPYSRLILKEKLSKRERLVILLTLMPMLEPQALNVFFALNPLTNRNFAEFGGKADPSYGSFIPTLETAIFLLGGRDWRGRHKAAELFSPSADFPVQKMIDIQRASEGASIFRGALTLKNTYYSQLIEGKPYFPRFSSEFPASRLSTSLTWDDLVLNPGTRSEVRDILNWLQYNAMIQEDWQLRKRIKNGYRSLFYGPSGTGKTLAATLLGRKMNKEVYRVDLSQIVSKWIGETEKNMANIFDQAEDKEWILFFDEADAIFGKRVKTSSSNDQHSNQQVAYLLQRIEDFPGVVILATNFKSNMDKAFARRFQSIINFSVPNYESRLKLWEASIPPEFPFEDGIDVNNIAKKYTVTGGMIINILQNAILSSMADNLNHISEDHLIEGIRKELAKEGKNL